MCSECIGVGVGVVVEDGPAIVLPKEVTLKVVSGRIQLMVALAPFMGILCAACLWSALNTEEHYSSRSCGNFSVLSSETAGQSWEKKKCLIQCLKLAI